MSLVRSDTLVDGRYRVVNRIGSGGMADVYCAEYQQLGRKVALKLLHERFAEDPEFVERFRREASAAAGLQHPNVVAVYDRGEWDDTYYIAMEFLPGRSVKQIVRDEGPVDPDRAIDITIGVLKELRFAHRRGIVHRDFKPHNVLVDSEGRAKVTDFGIARAGASDMTETGSIMGTAQYLSPEQAQGHAVSAESDLYSIGIMLYELLTGRVPFDGDSPVTIALKQVSEEPVPPSQRRAGLPPRLEDAVMRALAKDPAQRFQDDDGFIAALQAARGTAGVRADATRVVPSTGAYPPVAAVPVADPLVELEEEDRRSRRWIWWLLALLVLAGLAVGAFMALQPDERAVPKVVGLRAETAAQILNNAGFEVDIETVQSDSVRKNRVATQRPQPGTRVEEGSTVTIRVSSGPGEAAIPDVVGDGRREAERRVRQAGFKPAVEQRFSDEVPRNRVIETRPVASTQVEKGSTVVLVVSRGAEQVEVPDVRSLDREAAQGALRERDLEVTVSEEETDEEEPGEVLRQDPAPGTRVDKGRTVTIVIAKAPSEVEVPDVVDSDVNDAVDALTQAGFTVRQRQESVDTPDEDGVVLTQDPGPGERREKGSRVSITVGDFSPDEPLDEAPGEGDPGTEEPVIPTPDPSEEVP